MGDIDNSWIKFENHLLNEGVTKARLNKLKTMYNTVQLHNPKDIKELTRQDIEIFINKLNRNKIKRLDKKLLSGSTKSDIKKFLRQYFKWHKGNGEFYPEEVRWIKTRISKDEKPTQKPVVTIPEVKKLAREFTRPELKILTLLLFDSGFRINELLTITKKDLSWEDYDVGQKCFWVQCKESKTLTRKIPIPLFTEDIKTFVNSTYYEALKPNEKVFNITYDAYLLALRRKSVKLFNKRISPHALRHSSATYYSRELDGNMNLICQRYGWSFGSDIAKTYIRQSGAYQKQSAKKVFTNKIMEVKEESAQLREELNNLKKNMKPVLLELFKSFEGVVDAKKSEQIEKWLKSSK